MADRLVELGQKAWFRKTVSTLNLPLPMPQALRRADRPWQTQELDGLRVAVSGQAGPDLRAVLTEAGAALPADSDRWDVLVHDLRLADSLADLDEMHAFFHQHVRDLAPCGRAIVLARLPRAAESPEAAVVAQGAVGFVKSLAKEVGRRGATATVLHVAADADEWLAGPLRFVASARSAFFDAQVVEVSRPDGAQLAPVWESPLEGRVALVTGAARGIGAATARRLAGEGARLILLDIPQAAEDLTALADELGAEPLTLDITQADAAKRVQAVAKGMGGLDVLVNNAGITRDRTLAKMDAERWRQALAVNLDAAFRLSVGLLDTLGSGGRTICLSSIAGIAGNFGQTNYATAKAGLVGAVRALAPRYAAAGATINAVAPGFIETKMTAAVPFVTREAGRRLAALGQGGQPVDVAEFITFLASGAAAGLNGQTFRVCGGNFLGA